MKDSAYKNVWEYRIKTLFENREKTMDQEAMLWNIISLFVYSNSKDQLLVDVYNFFDDKNDFIQFISLLDGRSFRSPTKEEIEDALLTAVFYYEKEVNGKSWKEIQENLDFEISPIKYGIKVKNLNSWIRQKIQEIIVQGENSNE